jgi:lysophospholipase L1-like esterase
MSSHQLRIFLTGDSTVQNYDESEKIQGGWGEFLRDFFTDHVQVIN